MEINPESIEDIIKSLARLKGWFDSNELREASEALGSLPDSESIVSDQPENERNDDELLEHPGHAMVIPQPIDPIAYIIQDPDAEGFWIQITKAEWEYEEVTYEFEEQEYDGSGGFKVKKNGLTQDTAELVTINNIVYKADDYIYVVKSLTKDGDIYLRPISGTSGLKLYALITGGTPGDYTWSECDATGVTIEDGATNDDGDLIEVNGVPCPTDVEMVVEIEASTAEAEFYFTATIPPAATREDYDDLSFVAADLYKVLSYTDKGLGGAKAVQWDWVRGHA